MALTNRRSFLLGFGAALASPAIVRAESLMKIAAPKLITPDTSIWLIDWGSPMLIELRAAAMKATMDASMFGFGAIQIDLEKTRHVPVQDIYSRMKEA